MRKLIRHLNLSGLFGAVVLTFTATNVAYSWTLIDESISGKKFYIDQGTVKTVNGLTYFWKLTNLPSPNDTTLNWHSKISYQRVNCATMESQALFDYFYDEEMANGNFLMELLSPDDNWRKLKKNSVGRYVASKACE